MEHTNIIIERKAQKLQQKKLISFFVDFETSQKIKLLAKNQKRTIKATILCALDLYCESHGIEDWDT